MLPPVVKTMDGGKAMGQDDEQQEEQGLQRAHLHLMVDDPRFSDSGRPEALVEGEYMYSKYFLNGPVTPQLAVLDFDETTGALRPGVRYVPPQSGAKLGHYEVPPKGNLPDPTTREFNRVSAFATVLKTIQKFENTDFLGRPVRWAFDAPQLLVVPRAGQMENAYYERDSHSLQFFYFPSDADEDKMIYTSLARDIVAHETGHAVLDGISPYLFVAISPESRALHEAIGDLTALLLSTSSDKLCEAVLKKTGGSIRESTHFSAVAEQFGMARGQGALRNLYDDDVNMGSVECEPHDMSRVLSATLYSLLVAMHEKRQQLRVEQAHQSPYSASGYALATASEQLGRMAIRALEYLPSGEVSFADYGRAIIAADMAGYPEEGEERELLRRELVRRKAAPSLSSLAVGAPAKDALKGIDLEELVSSDWAAYAFANSSRGRDLLAIPKRRQFEIEPRTSVTRSYHRHLEDGTKYIEKVNECLFKVSWYEREPNRLGSEYPSERRVKVGTTVAWNRDTGELRALLSTGNGDKGELAQQREQRDLALASMVKTGQLRSGAQHLGPDGRPLRSVASMKVVGQTMRMDKVAQMLQFARGV
jgi:hypothetical protein